MRFLRGAIVIYRFLSAIKALITVMSQSLLANAVLMATLEMWLDREGNRSVPLAAGWVGDALPFRAARGRQGW